MDGITHQKITKNHKFRVLFCYHMVSFMLEKWKSDPVVSFLNSKAAGSIIKKTFKIDQQYYCKILVAHPQNQQKRLNLVYEKWVKIW